MNFSRVLRWSVAVLIPLTLAWKIAIPPFNPDLLKRELVEFFERNGFNVVVTDQLVNYVPVIQANTDLCRLLVARLTPDEIKPRSHSIAYRQSGSPICNLSR